MSKHLDPFDDPCGCLPRREPGPEAGEGTLFYKTGQRRVAISAEPTILRAIPGTADAEDFPAVRWYGKVGLRRVEGQQFDFPAFEADDACALAHRVLFIGPASEWPELEVRDRLARRFGGENRWIVAWTRTDEEEVVPKFSSVTFLTDTFIAPAGPIEPERYSIL